MDDKSSDKGKHKKTVNVLEAIFSGNKDDHVKSDAENVELIIKEWLDPKHIKRKTRYTKRQVMAVTVLQSLADTYNIKTLKRYLVEFRTNKLSEDGKSSQELESILKSRIINDEEGGFEKISKFLE